MTPQTFSLHHHHIAGLRWGNADSPRKVLAIHGWLDNAASFAPLSEHLKGADVLAIDLIGHGHSSHRSADAHYHLADWIQDIAELIQVLDWTQFDIIGHSLGGILGSIYSASFPEQVRSLTMIEAFGPLSEQAETSPTQLSQSIRSRLAMNQKTAKHPKSLEQAIIARARAGDVTRNSAEILVRRNVRCNNDKVRWRSDPRLRTVSSLRLTEEQAKAFMAVISCPVLTVLGSRGFEKIKVNLQRRDNIISDLRLIECEGGHHVHMDDSEGVAQAIATFWQQKSAINSDDPATS